MAPGSGKGWICLNRELDIKPPVLPVFCAVFSLSVGALVGHYIALFYSGWHFPIWLYALLAVFALESVYYSAYVLSPRTPFTWRLLEVGMIGVLTSLLLRLGNNAPYPWWALWRSFPDLGFLIPFSIALLVWAVAGGLGHRLARIAKVRDELGDQAASTLSWEYDSLAMKGANTALPIEYFLVRLIGFGLLTACLAVAAQRTGALQGVTRREQLVLAAFHLLTLTSGLLVLGCAYLYRLATIWQQIKVVYPLQLFSRWLRNLLVVCLGVAVIISLMPVDFSPITFDHIAGGLVGLLMRITSGSPSMEPREVSGQSEVQSSQIPWEQLEGAEPPFWVGVMTLIYMVLTFGLLGLAVAVFLGFLVVSLAQGELERLRGLPHAAARLYLVVRDSVWQLGLFFLRYLRRVKGVNLPRHLAAPFEELSPQASPRGPRRESAASRDIRGAFRQLLRAAAAVGLAPGVGETPAEFGQRLTVSLPEHDGEIRDFLESYHLARYSQRDLEKTLRERALEQARRIAAGLQRIVRGKENE